MLLTAVHGCLVGFFLLCLLWAPGVLFRDTCSSLKVLVLTRLKSYSTALHWLPNWIDWLNLVQPWSIPFTSIPLCCWSSSTALQTYIYLPVIRFQSSTVAAWQRRYTCVSHIKPNKQTNRCYPPFLVLCKDLSIHRRVIIDLFCGNLVSVWYGCLACRCT